MREKEKMRVRALSEGSLSTREEIFEPRSSFSRRESVISGEPLSRRTSQVFDRASPVREDEGIEEQKPVFAEKRVIPRNPEFSKDPQISFQLLKFFAKYYGLYMVGSQTTGFVLEQLRSATLNFIPAGFGVVSSLLSRTIVPLQDSVLSPACEAFFSYMPETVTGMADRVFSVISENTPSFLGREALSNLFQGASGYLGWAGSTLVNGAFTGLAFMITITIFHGILGKISSEFSKIPELWAYSTAFEELEDMTESQYAGYLSEQTGRSPEEFSAVLDIEKLKEVNPDRPLDVLKPVLAGLRVLEKEIKTASESLEQLTASGNWRDVVQLVEKTLRPLIFRKVYLKNLLSDICAPQMGRFISPSEGVSEYYSDFLSSVVGTKITFPLKALSAEAIEEEAGEFFMRESAVQKKIYGHLPF